MVCFFITIHVKESFCSSQSPQGIGLHKMTPFILYHKGYILGLEQLQLLKLGFKTGNCSSPLTCFLLYSTQYNYKQYRIQYE